MGRRPPGGDACVHVREKLEPAARTRITQARAIPARGWAKRHGGTPFGGYCTSGRRYGASGRWCDQLNTKTAYTQEPAKASVRFSSVARERRSASGSLCPRVMRPGSSAELALPAHDRSHLALTFRRETRRMAGSHEAPMNRWRIRGTRPTLAVLQGLAPHWSRGAVPRLARLYEAWALAR
jgi:hypothetical protein